MKNAVRVLVVVGGVLVGGVLPGADAPVPPPEPAAPAVVAAVPDAPAPVVAEPAPAAVPEPVPPVAPKPEPFRAVTVWSGAIVEVKLSAEAQKWRDMDALLKETRFKAEEGLDKPAVDRSPADGKQYAILTMKLREKRSVGKYDYFLRVNGTDCPCLAIGTEGAPFDPRAWEHKHAPNADEVMLIFEVPNGATEGTLVAGLPLTVSQPDAPIKLVLDVPPPPVAEAPPATPAVSPVGEAVPPALPLAAPATAVAPVAPVAP